MNIALRNLHQSCMGTWWMHKNKIILKCQRQDQTHKKTMKIILGAITFEPEVVETSGWLQIIPWRNTYRNGTFHSHIRGAVLRHMTSQHRFLQFFLTKINDGHGQGQSQRSRSKVKLSQNQYKSKIPYYREEKRSSYGWEGRRAKKRSFFWAKLS